MPEERDLKELEDVLWEAFDDAKRDKNDYENWDDSTVTHPNNLQIENRKALGELAQGIAAVRRERRLEKLADEQQRIEDEMDKGLKSGVTPLSTLKLRNNGNP